MDVKVAAIILTGLCGIVLMIGILKRKAAVLLNFVVRMVLGSVGIIFLNQWLESQGIAVAAGLNVCNVLTIGTLGTSGFALIYGILFYHLL